MRMKGRWVYSGVGGNARKNEKPIKISK